MFPILLGSPAHLSHPRLVLDDDGVAAIEPVPEELKLEPDARRYAPARIEPELYGEVASFKGLLNQRFPT